MRVAVRATRDGTADRDSSNLFGSLNQKKQAARPWLNTRPASNRIRSRLSPKLLTATTYHVIRAPASLAGALENRVVPVRARSLEPQSDPTKSGPNRLLCASAVTGLATRKPMLSFSFVGLLLFRFDDDKLLELLFQLPPRKPREDKTFAPGPPFSCQRLKTARRSPTL